MRINVYMLLFHARTISRDSENVELAHLKIEKHLAALLLSSLVLALFHATRSLVGHEWNWRWMVRCYNGLLVQEILRELLCACAIPTVYQPHDKSDRSHSSWCMHYDSLVYIHHYHSQTCGLHKWIIRCSLSYTSSHITLAPTSDGPSAVL